MGYSFTVGGIEPSEEQPHGLGRITLLLDFHCQEVNKGVELDGGDLRSLPALKIYVSLIAFDPHLLQVTLSSFSIHF